jgi:hypothetical protein
VRVPYIALVLATIVMGLFIHLHGDWLPPDARDMLGDALWAAMVTWIVLAIAPRTKLLICAALALAFCFAIELSQLHHSPGLDALRRTTAGHLVLGSGFDPRDLAAYSAGVFAAVVSIATKRLASK